MHAVVVPPVNLHPCHGVRTDMSSREKNFTRGGGFPAAAGMQINNIWLCKNANKERLPKFAATLCRGNLVTREVKTDVRELLIEN